MRVAGGHMQDVGQCVQVMVLMMVRDARGQVNKIIVEIVGEIRLNSL